MKIWREMESKVLSHLDDGHYPADESVLAATLMPQQRFVAAHHHRQQGVTVQGLTDAGEGG